MRLLISSLGLSVFALLTVLTTEVQAEKKQVKIIKEWKGSVADEKLQGVVPACITTAKSLEKLWTAWKLPEEMPKVDFDKEIVLVATTVGSLLNVSARLDDNGDLEVLAMATRDIRPGFRYVFATVSREGIKTVDKKPLPPSE